METESQTIGKKVTSKMTKSVHELCLCSSFVVSIPYPPAPSSSSAFGKIETSSSPKTVAGLSWVLLIYCTLS